MRSTRSFGPILAERGETIGRGKIAFGYTYQFFSFDHLDGVPLTNVPAVFTHDNPQARRRPSRRRGDGQHHRGDGQPVHRRADVRVDRSRSISRWRCPSSRRGCRCSRTRRSTASAPAATSACTTSAIRMPSAATDRHRQYFAEGLRCRHRRSRGARQGDADARGHACVRGRPRRAHCRPATSKNLLGSGALGVRPFAAFSASMGAFAPHANVAYQWNGESPLAGDVVTGEESRPPGSVHLRGRRRRARRDTPERHLRRARPARG